MARGSPADGSGTHQSSSLRVSVLVPQLGTGAVAISMLRVAEGLARCGHEVDLLFCRRQRGFDRPLPTSLCYVELEAASGLHARWAALRAAPAAVRMAAPVYLSPAKLPFAGRALPALVAYLRRQRPDVLVTALTAASVAGVQARLLARVSTRVIVTEHSTISEVLARSQDAMVRRSEPLLRWMFRQADAAVAVSLGAARDLAQFAALPAEKVSAIYEPAVTDAVLRAASEPCAHPWFNQSDVPVILGCGRLALQKDFPTLVRAFARLRQMRPARLVILGEGSGPGDTAARRVELMTLAQELGVIADVDLPGFATNPFCYMARAATFVLSSNFEGFAMVLAEALACGCPVVSTDCPHGPAEILERGRWGRLAAVGDDAGLAEAIDATLATPPDRVALRGRAAAFSVDAAVAGYDKLIRGI